jgi:NAD(P)-dependent dehydrogenase (short-subunit alcohol dehydrogenase family)
LAGRVDGPRAAGLRTAGERINEPQRRVVDESAFDAERVEERTGNAPGAINPKGRARASGWHAGYGRDIAGGSPHARNIDSTSAAGAESPDDNVFLSILRGWLKPAFKTLKNMGPDQWSKVIGVDLDSVFYCSRAVIEQMLERGYGRIINISSVVGQKGNFGQTNYAAAKAGIIGFTKALALETAKKGITVNAIAPGFVKTAMTEKIPKDVMDKIVGSIPVGRLAEPSEIARAIVFLSDEKSSYITGQVMGINGGFYM